MQDLTSPAAPQPAPPVRRRATPSRRSVPCSLAALSAVSALALALAACQGPRPAAGPAASAGGAHPATPAAAVSAAAAAPGSAATSASVTPPQPEGSSGWTPQPTTRFDQEAVAAAHPLAAEAGAEILKAGGSALDAAIAVQMVLGVVEPQSSGLGGGAFLLHADAKGRVSAYDGRETAPKAADEKLFFDAEGKPMRFHAAVVGGRAVGVPGVLAMLERAHRDHGRLPWARLFRPAIRIAEQGFEVGPRLHTLLAAEEHLPRQAVAARFYYDSEGKALPVGHLLRNPALALVLRRVARGGARAFYRGPVARSVVKAVRGHDGNPGAMSLKDLAGYRAVERAPLCHRWRRWNVCGFPPPSSGQLAVAQILTMADGRQGLPALLADGRSASPETLHRYTEAARLAYADRALYVADPGFVDPPGGHWNSLLDGGYLASREALIGPRSMGRAEAGRPGGAASAFAPQRQDVEAGTSHLSIVDREGRAVVMTTTIEDVFGARQLVDGGTGKPGGFLLNNQLTDFSFAPADAAGQPIANRVQPGKRPRSSMSPTLVFECTEGAAAAAEAVPEPAPAAMQKARKSRKARPPVGAAAAPGCERLVLAAGSAGGAFIIHHVAQTIRATLAWGLPVQQAVELPHAGSMNGPTLLEAGRYPASTIDALRAGGHEVREMTVTSGLHVLMRTGEGWSGGADPRREGAVRGQ